jgi:hypothetical protein
MGDILIIRKYVDLKQEGREWIGMCPFHQDSKPSLKVNPEKNIFKCFACGAGGSAAHFLFEWNKLKGTRIKLEPKSADIKPEVKDRIDDWKIVTPVPSYIEQPSFRHINHGVPNFTWRYTNEKGQVMFYVCRFNKPDKTKEVLPYTYCTKNGVFAWKWRGLRDKRPLYNLCKLSKSSKPVCLVEGEKCADAGNDNSEIFDFTTFQGGSNAYQLTDYAPLQGKDVVLIHDNDEAGLKCMLGVRKLLKPYAKSIYMMREMKDLPKKWDVADVKWKSGELDAFIKERIIR